MKMCGSLPCRSEFFNARMWMSPLLPEQAPPAWAIALRSRVAREYGIAPSKGWPLMAFRKPQFNGTYGGRWFPNENAIAVWDGDDPAMTRTVVLHELCHWMRSLKGDLPGHHDEDFLTLVEDVYRKFKADPESVRVLEMGTVVI
jgi:hypothetical protein